MAVVYLDEDLLIHKHAHYYMFIDGYLIHRECSIFKNPIHEGKAYFLRFLEEPKMNGKFANLGNGQYGEVSLYPGEVMNHSLWLGIEDEYLAKQLLIQHKQKVIRDIYVKLEAKKLEVKELQREIESLEHDIALMK